MHLLFKFGFAVNGIGVLILAVTVILSQSVEVTDTFGKPIGTMTSVRGDVRARPWKMLAEWCVNGSAARVSALFILVGLLLQVPDVAWN